MVCGWYTMWASMSSNVKWVYGSSTLIPETLGVVMCPAGTSWGWGFGGIKGSPAAWFRASLMSRLPCFLVVMLNCGVVRFEAVRCVSAISKQNSTQISLAMKILTAGVISDSGPCLGSLFCLLLRWPRPSQSLKSPPRQYWGVSWCLSSKLPPGEGCISEESWGPFWWADLGHMPIPICTLGTTRCWWHPSQVGVLHPTFLGKHKTSCEQVREGVRSFSEGSYKVVSGRIKKC